MLTKVASHDIHSLDHLDSSIYALSYNGFYNDHKSLFHIMELQDNYLKHNGEQFSKLCVLFFHTKMSRSVAEQLAKQIHHHSSSAEKIAIVGVVPKDRSMLRLLLLKENTSSTTYRFFHTLNAANTWLMQ